MSHVYPSNESLYHASPKTGARGPYKSVRRPGLQEFDSLQDLLEQAGYKETRIYTPVANKMSASSPPQMNREIASPTRRVSTSNCILETQVRKGEPNTSWFSTLWNASDGKSNGSQEKSLRRKQSEPSLSKKGRKGVQKSWTGFWDVRRKEQGEDENSIPPVPPLPQHSSSSSEGSTSKQSQPQLRQTPSTNNLWQGSIDHHRSRLASSRSIPARLRDHKGKTLMRKESFDGARVVACVGFGAASTTTARDVFSKGGRASSMSLRQAFGQDEVVVMKKEKDTNNYTSSSKLAPSDSVSSIVDLDNERPAPDAETTTEMEHAAAPIPKLKTISSVSLFSTAASPLLSRQDAVALRNVGCLDFAGMQEGTSMTGKYSKNLRKMRSVDALQLALLKMEKQEQTGRNMSSQHHDTIPESSSLDSLTNEDFANATTTTTLFSSDAHSERVPSASAATPSEPIRRSTTPRLVITSPTGMRSPQTLDLEGQEFEPRSISPQSIQKMIRPVASRRSGWRIGAQSRKPKPQADSTEEESERGRKENTELAESRLPSNIPRRQSSKKKERTARNKEHNSTAIIPQGALSQLPVPAKVAKRRLSRSCSDLRGNILTQKEIGMTGKISGSEQIRALRRDVMNRNNGGMRQTTSQANENARQCFPPSTLSNNDDDPFNDLSSSQSKANKQASHLDWSANSSYVPSQASQASQRRPLTSTQQYNAQQHSTDPTVALTKTLARKPSGVGLACLVEKENTRAARMAALSNEGDLNPLLDSPTANYVKKKSSRPRLTQL
jgi:hypothetical protein